MAGYRRCAPSHGGEEALLVRPGGLEPPTFWSVARRSIQLSYGRFSYLAEREGFEPSVQLPVQLLSRQLPSATRAPLLICRSCQALRMAEGEGIEPPRAQARRFSRPLPYQLGLALRPPSGSIATPLSGVKSNHPSPLPPGAAAGRHHLVTSSSSNRSQSDGPVDMRRPNVRSPPTPTL